MHGGLRDEITIDFCQAQENAMCNAMRPQQSLNADNMGMGVGDKHHMPLCTSG